VEPNLRKNYIGFYWVLAITSFITTLETFPKGGKGTKFFSLKNIIMCSQIEDLIVYPLFTLFIHIHLSFNVDNETQKEILSLLLE
jgi:hypothetical protein